MPASSKIQRIMRDGNSIAARTIIKRIVKNNFLIWFVQFGGRKFHKTQVLSCIYVLRKQPYHTLVTVVKSPKPHDVPNPATQRNENDGQ